MDIKISIHPDRVKVLEGLQGTEISESVAILNSNFITTRAADKEIEDIDRTDFISLGRSIVENFDVLLLVLDGKVKIMKNRYRRQDLDIETNLIIIN